MFIERLDNLDKPFLNVETSEYMPEAVVPHSVKGFLEVNEVVEQVFLVLEVFLDEDPAVEDLSEYRKLPSQKHYSNVLNIKPDI